MAGRVTRDVVSFGERLLGLLDQGAFVATYKYAVLLGLMDLCLEGTNRHGAAPESVTTRQLAEKVIELYWPQTAEFRGRLLKQNSGRQARIVSDILRLRSSLSDPSATIRRAKSEAPALFERLVRDVEWTLILMPLPRLQVVSGVEERLVFNIAWDTTIDRRRSVVREYQRRGTGSFDNQIRLLPGVGAHLVALNGLLRPLIHRAWAAMVAGLNGLDESRLEQFLFGADRARLARVRPGLVELQHGKCFYCGGRLTQQAHVDHFIPWARHPDDGIDNLVVADRACNAAKKDFLAAADHVRRWRARSETAAADLGDLARAEDWDSHPHETVGVARGIYLRLPSEARLWLSGLEFVPADRASLRNALG